MSVRHSGRIVVMVSRTQTVIHEAAANTKRRPVARDPRSRRLPVGPPDRGCSSSLLNGRVPHLLRSRGRFENPCWLADVECHEALLNLMVVRDHRPRPVAAGRLKLQQFPLSRKMLSNSPRLDALVVEIAPKSHCGAASREVRHHGLTCSGLDTRGLCCGVRYLRHRATTRRAGHERV